MSNSRSKPTVERRKGAKSKALRMSMSSFERRTYRARKAPGGQKSGFRAANFKAWRRLCADRFARLVLGSWNRGNASMLNRRTFIAAAASGLVAGRGLAQSPSPRRYGYPAGTKPFGPEVYRERRRRLMERMKGGVAIVYGARTIDGSSSVAGGGRQHSDFVYLTGLMDEPGAVLLLAPGERTYREILFVAPLDPEMERYEGFRLPISEELRARTGFERVLRTNWLGTTLAQIAARARQLHYLGPLAAPDAPIPAELDLYGRVAARVPGSSIVNNHNLVRSMRAAKEPRELELMRRAIAATARGVLAGMRAVRPGMR